ncbi:UNVERIFIED_CONTAM: hypothetical protein Sradi_3561800 [Sesamum radiatum]|uniref:Uncharacterized protein n=1 Tax=Sesamum radiatum TaxID=300843 RepID=A0AAW2QFT0_SESRA
MEALDSKLLLFSRRPYHFQKLKSVQALQVRVLEEHCWRSALAVVQNAVILGCEPGVVFSEDQ